MVDFRVVILSRKPENAIKCVSSIFKNDPTIKHEHIIIVDDGAGTEEAKAQLPGVTWVMGAKPFNFSRNANLGIVAADEGCVLLNDDTELLTTNGLTIMVTQAPLDAITIPQLEGHVAAQYKPGINKSDSYATFVGVYIPRFVYLRVGPLDERYIRYGFEDTDYCHRAKQIGLGVMTFGGCTLYHNREVSTFHGPESTNGITHFYDGDNADIFYKKWERTTNQF